MNIYLYILIICVSTSITYAKPKNMNTVVFQKGCTTVPPTHSIRVSVSSHLINL